MTTARQQYQEKLQHDTDSGLGIGGINNDQALPAAPTIAGIRNAQKRLDNDIVCKRCHSRKSDGAMFTTMAGSGICDDCI